MKVCVMLLHCFAKNLTSSRHTCIFYRTVGDQSNPPILPWVTDFTSKIDLENELDVEDHALSSPWRDLTKVRDWIFQLLRC